MVSLSFFVACVLAVVVCGHSHTHTCIHSHMGTATPHTAPQPRGQDHHFHGEAAPEKSNIRITVLAPSLSDPRAYCTSVTDSRSDLNDNWFDCRESDVLTAAKKALLLNVILPEAVAFLQQALKVERLTAPVVVPTVSCWNTFPIPESDRTLEVPATDFVLYVTAARCANGTSAWARTCALSEAGRPLIGHINFAPSSLDIVKDEVPLKYIVKVAIHEILHALGFNSAFAAANNMLRQTSIRDKTTTAIFSSEVVKQAQEYFNCSKMASLEWEDQGAGSHWDKRVMMNEVMAGTLTEGEITRSVSRMTLAFFKDSGHYDVNYTVADDDDLWYGKRAGCAFINEPCNSDSNFDRPEFCWDTSYQACTGDRLAIGYCNVGDYMLPIQSTFQYFSTSRFMGGAIAATDYCPFRQAYGGSICAGDALPKAMAPSADTEGSVYGPDSRCIMTTDADGNLTLSGLRRKDLLNTTAFWDGPRCLRVRCPEGSRVELQVGGSSEWVRCPLNGTAGTVDAPTGYQGKILCPSVQEVCNAKLWSPASTSRHAFQPLGPRTKGKGTWNNNPPRTPYKYISAPYRQPSPFWRPPPPPPGTRPPTLPPPKAPVAPLPKAAAPPRPIVSSSPPSAPRAATPLPRASTSASRKKTNAPRASDYAPRAPPATVSWSGTSSPNRAATSPPFRAAKSSPRAPANRAFTIAPTRATYLSNTTSSDVPVYRAPLYAPPRAPTNVPTYPPNGPPRGYLSPPKPPVFSIPILAPRTRGMVTSQPRVTPSPTRNPNIPLTPCDNAMSRLLSPDCPALMYLNGSRLREVPLNDLCPCFTQSRLSGHEEDLVAVGLYCNAEINSVVQVAQSVLCVRPKDNQTYCGDQLYDSQWFAKSTMDFLSGKYFVDPDLFLQSTFDNECTECVQLASVGAFAVFGNVQAITTSTLCDSTCQVQLKAVTEGLVGFAALYAMCLQNDNWAQWASRPYCFPYLYGLMDSVGKVCAETVEGDCVRSQGNCLWLKNADGTGACYATSEVTVLETGDGTPPPWALLDNFCQNSCFDRFQASLVDLGLARGIFEWDSRIEIEARAITKSVCITDDAFSSPCLTYLTKPIPPGCPATDLESFQTASPTCSDSCATAMSEYMRVLGCCFSTLSYLQKNTDPLFTTMPNFSGIGMACGLNSTDMCSLYASPPVPVKNISVSGSCEWFMANPYFNTDVLRRETAAILGTDNDTLLNFAVKNPQGGLCPSKNTLAHSARVLGDATASSGLAVDFDVVTRDANTATRLARAAEEMPLTIPDIQQAATQFAVLAAVEIVAVTTCLDTCFKTRTSVQACLQTCGTPAPATPAGGTPKPPTPVPRTPQPPTAIQTPQPPTAIQTPSPTAGPPVTEAPAFCRAIPTVPTPDSTRQCELLNGAGINAAAESAGCDTAYTSCVNAVITYYVKCSDTFVVCETARSTCYFASVYPLYSAAAMCAETFTFRTDPQNQFYTCQQRACQDGKAANCGETAVTIYCNAAKRYATLMTPAPTPMPGVTTGPSQTTNAPGSTVPNTPSATGTATHAPNTESATNIGVIAGGVVGAVVAVAVIGGIVYYFRQRSIANDGIGASNPYPYSQPQASGQPQGRNPILDEIEMGAAPKRTPNSHQGFDL